MPPDKTFICATEWHEMAIEAPTSRAAAEQYVEGGDWAKHSETTWISVSVWERGHGRTHADTIKVEVQPDEPDCHDGRDHEWMDRDDLRGHGAGVVYTEACRHCGTVRTIDTWAMDPADGAQGLESVSYE